METIGVEAVVEGLQSFLGDMGKVNSALNGLRPSGTLLEQMFASISGAVGGFGREVLNVVETALGVMLRDAIEGIIRSLGDLVQSIIDTGAEFQTLKIRLTGLNLNEFADGTRDFASAMEMAGEKTNEEIEWLQTLGAATPFDPAQIADTYTQARAFGFAADEAKRLTTDIINYTAGMGLSNETLFLVIQNLGQMVQRGKVTGTEIRDLARGSFLPLNDVLQRMAKNLGITVAELTKKISTPAGIPASEFVKAFEQMVEEEPRFIGAAGRLSRAFLPATQNVKELFTSIFGLNIVTPIFDVLGEKVASLVDIFVNFNEQGDLVKTQRWEDLVAAASNLGKVLADLISQILGFIPTGESMADALILGLNRMTVWITNNRGGIIGFFRGIGDTIQNDVVPFVRDQLIPAIAGFGQWIFENKEIILAFFTNIGSVISNTLVPFVRDQLVPAFNQISEWVNVNGPLIQLFFGALGEIITTVFSKLFGTPPAGAGQDFLTNFLETLTRVMDWIIKNKDQIAQWATTFIQVFLAVQVAITIFNVLITVIIAVVGAFLTVIGIVSTVATVIGFLADPIALLIVAIVALAILLIANWDKISTAAQQLWFLVKFFFTNLWNDLVAIFTRLWGDITRVANSIWSDLKDKFNKIWTDIKGIDWLGLGKSLIEGIGQGISNAANWLANTVKDAVMGAYNAALSALGIRSPSKLFAEVGKFSMEGFAVGIEKYAGMAAGAMTAAMQQVAAPTLSMPSIIQSVVAQGGGSTTSNTRSQTYNLTVNSSANAEPIVQDFNMLSSLAG